MWYAHGRSTCQHMRRYSTWVAGPAYPYAAILSEAGLALVGNYTDEGESYYYDATRA